MQKDYSIADDFPNGFNLVRFEIELEASSFAAKYDFLVCTGDDLEMYLTSALDAAEETELTTIIGAHDGTPPPPPPPPDGFWIGATGVISTTSGSFVLATSMTITPGAGTWRISFRGNYVVDDTSEAVIATIYANGAEVSAAARSELREMTSTTTERVPFKSEVIATVADGQAIEGRWATTAGAAGTMEERTLTLARVG